MEEQYEHSGTELKVEELKFVLQFAWDLVASVQEKFVVIDVCKHSFNINIKQSIKSNNIITPCSNINIIRKAIHTLLCQVAIL